MIFRNLTLQGFRSFKAEQSLDFPKGPGLFLITGKNKLHPEKGPNAVGKSSIPSGLCWVLYGKTERGLKASDIGNWEASDLTAGSVDIANESGVYRIKRTWDPNSLTLQQGSEEPKTVTQDRIDELLGMTLDQFLFVVLMGQFNQFFFDLGPTEKLQLFSDALNLGYWMDRSKQAKENAKEGAKVVDALDRGLAVLRERLQSVHQQRDEWAKLSESFTEQQEQQLEKLRLERTELKKDRDQLESLLANKKKLLPGYEEEVDRRKARIGALQQDVQSLNTTRLRTKDKIQRAKDDLAALEGAKEQCPTCGQRMDRNHYRKERDRLNREVQELLAEKVRQEEILEHAEKEVETLRPAFEKEVDRAADLKAEIRQLEQDLRDNERDLTTTQERIRETKERDDPYRAKLAKVEEEAERLKVQDKEQEDQLAKARREVDGWTNWVGYFKELRLQLIEDAVSELEVEVNNALPELGLLGWEVRCVVEKETGKGTVQRGFEVMISSPESGDKPVKWASWSGGETQRLRIAGALGLQRMMAEKLGVRMAIEVWDEPTAHLSEAGVADLVAYFGQRAREEGRQVWLIDHRSLSAGDYDGEVRVVLDEGGSRLVSRIEG